jgi:ribosomal protein L7/L12
MALFGPDPVVIARLAHIERKLDTLLAHLNIEVDDGLEVVRRLAAAGDKIGAIKEHRRITGSGLVEAKAFVEQAL